MVEVMDDLPRLLALAAPFLLSPTAAGQTVFYGQEPNNSKETATEAFGMVAGDSLATCGDLFSLFRVRTAALSPGIYRHVLVESTTVEPARVRILGCDADVDDVVQGSLAVLASSEDVPTGANLVAWYGFGKAEELYVDLADVGGCQALTHATLQTTPVQPLDMGALPGPAGVHLGWTTVRADGRGGQLDTEVHIFDAEFNAIPGGWSDDRLGPRGPAVAYANLAPGTYYAAIADTGLSSHLPPTAAEWAVPAQVTDFAGPLVAGSHAAQLDFDVTVERLGTGMNLQATVTKTQPFSAVWVRFTIGSGQSTSSFCPGDGTIAVCPCGNDSPHGAAMGCSNSTGRGATMLYEPYVSSWQFQLTIEDLPPNASTLGFVADATSTARPVHGGLLCLGSGSVRLALTSANDDGTAVLRDNVFGVGSFMLGQTLYAQAVYRDPNGPGGCLANVSSGIAFPLL